VNGLYGELRASEESMLLLTKRHEMLKRNSKAYRDDVAAKIGKLREQVCLEIRSDQTRSDQTRWRGDTMR
jgi:hypothetical protein